MGAERTTLSRTYHPAGLAEQLGDDVRLAMQISAAGPVGDYLDVQPAGALATVDALALATLGTSTANLATHLDEGGERPNCAAGVSALMKANSSTATRGTQCEQTELAFSTTQRYCWVVPIPDFDPRGVLPPGVHVATWSEVRDRYGVTDHRRRLLGGLEKALLSLKEAGCRRAYLDGSFVTSKQHPGDFDGCWEEEDVDPDKLHPALLIFEDQRALQKAVFFGEMFPAATRADRRGSPFLSFFQSDKDTGEAKGIVAIDLTEWTP